MVASVIDIFKDAVSNENARVTQLPPIILVFGAKLGDPNTSARQMFMNWFDINYKHPLSSQIRTPEQFKDWNNFDGYSNLVDFEIDASNLTKVIVLFSESVSAVAELGSFCMDPGISERLFVILGRDEYNAPSFIANGPIKKIEQQHECSVCVLDSIEPNEMIKEIDSLVQSLEDKIDSFSKTQHFNPERDRDQFLLAADLIELFSALTAHEIHELFKFMNVDIGVAKLKKITDQLLRFELAHFSANLEKRYFVAPENRISYINYTSPKGSSPFDRTRFKMLRVKPWLEGDRKRIKAYEAIYPKASS